MRIHIERHKAIGHERRNAPANFLGTVLAAAGATALVVAGFVFSLLFLAAALTIGVIVGGYLWWRTRDLRRQMRRQMEELARQQQARQPSGASGPSPARDGATIIEGEFVRERDARDPRA